MKSATATVTWVEANQQHLVAALGRVRSALERHAARAKPGDLAPSAAPPVAESPAATISGPPMALDILGGAFKLSAFERDVVVLCAGIELDGSLGALCASAQGSAQRPYPTFGLALAALPDAHWSALAPTAPLRHWRLVEVTPGSSLTTSALRIDERVLHFLAGVPGLDERLAGIVHPVWTAGEIVPSHRALADRIVDAWKRSAGAVDGPVVQLCGDAALEAREICAAAAAAVGLRLSALPGDLIPVAPNDTEALSRLWQREAVLSGGALLVECGDLDPESGPHAAALARFVEGLSGAVVVAAREQRRLRRRLTIALDVVKPTTDEQLAVWRASLGDAAETLNGQIERLVGQFRLSAPVIRAATGAALGSGAFAQLEIGDRVWDACRAQARPRLDDLAQRIEPHASWDDLVLPDAQKQILRDIGAHVRHRVLVYETWGFGRRSTRGLGLSALFAGASGTGKTMAAEVLANELRLDLYRIDLSSVVSKYIGETEKNLRRIFDAAEDGGAILLFDEADALFGKRSEVKDSHDRYANIEVSYLLQRMEAYRGLAILTTNLRHALDSAFLRRVLFVVEFPFPDAAHRAEIWRRVLPIEMPVDGLDAERLARLNVAGGNIRNIALNAAFLAADSAQPLRMSHMLKAARGEYAKMEKVLTESEVAGWM
ncbi:MAG TPA: ATP-binding protein [Gemmatimonadaceae bacterium]|nr:ATP-binding protein [Gemmatimonadaceae bacterium]